MAQVDFYQLSRDPVERVVPSLALRVLDTGGRLLVVSGDPGQRTALSDALWARGGFLAHGDAGAPHAERQPVLLSDRCEAENGARIAILADGDWREECRAFERTILLFAPEQRSGAQGLWRALREAGDALRIFKQDERGAWGEGR